MIAFSNTKNNRILSGEYSGMMRFVEVTSLKSFWPYMVNNDASMIDGDEKV